MYKHLRFKQDLVRTYFGNFVLVAYSTPQMQQLPCVPGTPPVDQKWPPRIALSKFNPCGFQMCCFVYMGHVTVIWMSSCCYFFFRFLVSWFEHGLGILLVLDDMKKLWPFIAVFCSWKVWKHIELCCIIPLILAKTLKHRHSQGFHVCIYVYMHTQPVYDV